MAAAARQVSNVLSVAPRFQIAIVIRETHDLIRIADIDPLRIRARRIKRDAIRPLQSARKDRGLFRLAV